MEISNMFLFVLQIIVAILLIIVVLIQSSDEDSLSGIGAGASKTSILTHKSSADPITKITIILGVILMINSFILTSISTHKYLKNKSLVKDYIEEQNKNAVDTDAIKGNDALQNIIDKSSK